VTLISAISRSARAEVVSLWIEVQGTRCPPCARGLEESVRRLDGVSKARFGGFAPQKLDIELKAGEIVDLEKVWKLIARQGYRLRKENTHLVLRGRLERFDAASHHGPWTHQTLELIEARPETRAEDIAASIGREKLPFKRDVRKLKELGLTESLLVGYRLSPRGRALLESLRGS